MKSRTHQTKKDADTIWERVANISESYWMESAKWGVLRRQLNDTQTLQAASVILQSAPLVGIAFAALVPVLVAFNERSGSEGDVIISTFTIVDIHGLST